MANAVYPKWKEAIIQASSNSALTGTVKCALVDTGTYTYSSAHDFYDDVAVAAVIGTPQTLATKTYTSGTLDADDLTYTSVSGASVEALILYITPGSPDISRLVLYLDTSQTGLPVTPNGGNITVTWNASGIFTISDRALKENIREVGDLHGILPIYEYNYAGDQLVYRGLMAQDVEKIVPAAVIEIGSRRRKIVDYGRAIEACERLAA